MRISLFYPSARHIRAPIEKLYHATQLTLIHIRYKFRRRLRPRNQRDALHPRVLLQIQYQHTQIMFN